MPTPKTRKPPGAVRRATGKARRAVSKTRRLSLTTVVWGLITTALLIVFLVVQGVLTLTLVLLSVAVTTLAAFADFAPGNQPVPAKPAKRAEQPKTGGNKGSARPSAARKPATAAKSTRRRVCSARCKASTKPLSTCECVCKGATHGAKHRDP